MSRSTMKTKKKSTVKRLVVANLVAALALLTVTVVTLFCLGLLDSIFAFLF
ncbi:MAG: hypothetical protein IJX39_04070 [Clostridia bacterium]|nr:hypothetical protein [Clostridia bacterium]